MAGWLVIQGYTHTHKTYNMLANTIFIFDLKKRGSNVLFSKPVIRIFQKQSKPSDLQMIEICLLAGEQHKHSPKISNTVLFFFFLTNFTGPFTGDLLEPRVIPFAVKYWD